MIPVTSMTLDTAHQLLAEADDTEPVTLPSSILDLLVLPDIPNGVSVQVGSIKANVPHLEWDGRIVRDGKILIGCAEYVHTRKYWYSPLGLEQYMDLIRRAVETRHRTHGDVELMHWDDDGAYIHLLFTIATAETNLGEAFKVIRRVAAQMEEAAQRAGDEVGERVAEIAARLSGWGSATLDELMNEVETAKSPDDKGRGLEELCSRLFSTVVGLSITGRIRTQTEEIDISILNDSKEPRLRRESALIIAECKNWTAKCGKDELVLFREKVENRHRRCSLGVLISWHGFTGTVTKEMLRGSREDTLIVPMTGQDIRDGVRNRNFEAVLLECWSRAVVL